MGPSLLCPVGNRKPNVPIQMSNFGRPVAGLCSTWSRAQTVIGFLANIFRQVHWIVGITAPAPGTNDRKFVFIWLAVIGFVILWVGFVLYLMLYVF